MRASILADLLLELNVVNVKDIDREINNLAAGASDPRTAAWIKRVARYFLINIEQLLSPRKLKAEPRGGYYQQPPMYGEPPEGTPIRTGSSKHHFQPTGSWTAKPPSTPPPKHPFGPTGIVTEPDDKTSVKCRTCAGTGKVARQTCSLCRGKGKIKVCSYCKGQQTIPDDPAKDKCPFCHGHGYKLVEAENDWYTQFHQPEVQRDIDRNFTPFAPKKAKTKGNLWGPPTKKQLEPWMTGYQAPAKTTPDDEAEKLKAEYQGLYHFDPIVVRRRELFIRLQDAVDYFNYLNELTGNIKSPDLPEQQKAQEAMDYLRRLETMKTADLDGFTDVMRDASEFKQEVRDNPYKFSTLKPTTVFTFADGFKWVHLHTKTQFEHEHDTLEHCVDTYWPKFQKGDCDIYSLRDPKGIAHISIEKLPPDRVNQVRSKLNSKPAAQYQPYIVPFLNHMRWKLTGDIANVDDARNVQANR